MIIENETDKKIIETFVSLSTATIRLFFNGNSSNGTELNGINFLKDLNQKACEMLK